MIRFFKKAMPNFIRASFLEELETATIQELCAEARQKLISRKLCLADEWYRDGFNEMGTDKSENFLAVLTKLKETQNSPENRNNPLTEKISQPKQGTSRQDTSQNFSNQQTWK